MRKVHPLLSLTVLIALAGCTPEGNRLNLLHSSGNKDLSASTAVPQKEDLVSYLNNNSARIPGIQSDDITLTYFSGAAGIPVTGNLRAQGPRNFRMRADVFGKPQVDFGSNNQEFWYWISQGEPYQVYCSYKAIEEGTVRVMPFKFQPDWVMEAMGMGNYGPPEKYELVEEGKQVKLIEKTKSPQGTPVKKVIVFNKNKATGKDEPQVTDFLLLEDPSNKLICSAHISRKQQLPGNGEIPREIELRWPEQKLKLVLHLNNVKLSQQFPELAFRRIPMTGIPCFDLATGRVDPVTRAGGTKGP